MIGTFLCHGRATGRAVFAFVFCGLAVLTFHAEAVVVSGKVTAASAPVASARMTLFTPDFAMFREVRTDANGNYAVVSVPAGTFKLGVAARGFQYQEINVTVGGVDVAQSFVLAPETHPGVWTLSGDISPELLEGTGSGTVLPTGEVLFCHDTIDPVCIDPATGVKWFPPTSGTPQGCHIATLLTRGDAYFGGGSMTGRT